MDFIIVRIHYCEWFSRDFDSVLYIARRIQVYFSRPYNNDIDTEREMDNFTSFCNENVHACSLDRIGGDRTSLALFFDYDHGNERRKSAHKYEKETTKTNAKNL